MAQSSSDLPVGETGGIGFGDHPVADQKASVRSTGADERSGGGAAPGGPVSSDPADLADLADPAVPLGRPGQRVEVRAIVWWASRSLVGVLIAAGLLVVGYRFTELPRGLLGTAAALVALVGACLVVIGPLWRYRVHRWQATDTAVYAVTGWLVVEWRLAPLTRVQTVDTVRGPLEQLFGLATLRVTTASASGPVVVPGLARKIAVAAAEALTEVTEQTRGDAT